LPPILGQDNQDFHHPQLKKSILQQIILKNHMQSTMYANLEKSKILELGSNN
jgi:hypothetical protein